MTTRRDVEKKKRMVMEKGTRKKTPSMASTDIIPLKTGIYLLALTYSLWLNKREPKLSPVEQKRKGNAFRDEALLYNGPRSWLDPLHARRAIIN